MTKPIDISHDPREFIRGLQQILISDSKKIAFLFGAGTSMCDSNPAARIPGIHEMTDKIIETITEIKFKKALQCIKEELISAHGGYQIEYILSNVIQKELVIGTEVLYGLSKDDYSSLKIRIEAEIVKIISVHKEKDKFISTLIHSDFARWIAQASRKHPIEVFTTNYDYLLEIGLEQNNIPYFDGFIGSFEPFFCTPFVEDFHFAHECTKLWKLHGSLGWSIQKETNRIVRKFTDDSSIIIYPSLIKYDNSRKQPYASFMDRLANFIRSEDGVLFVCGYSFSDQHINDVIMTALEKTPTSRVIVFLYDKERDKSGKDTFSFSTKDHLAQLAISQPKISVYGMRTAVIGGKFGQWRLKTEPDAEDTISMGLYFDEDAAIPTGSKGQGEHIWDGHGVFQLSDFCKFVSFLSYLNYDNFKNAGMKK